MQTKRCIKCSLEKPTTEFWVADKVRGYLQGTCKECQKSRMRRYYAENPEYRRKTKENRLRNPQKSRTLEQSRRHMLKNKYALTHLQYDALLLAQGGKCALCGSTENGINGRTKYFMVDHCHETGKIRGLLCHPCNARLGSHEALMKLVGIGRISEYLYRPSPVVLEPEVEKPQYPFSPAPYDLNIGECSVDGCVKKAKKIGLCSMHYQRTLENGEIGEAGQRREKLTDDQVRSILRDPRRYPVIAQEYGIHAQSVLAIKARSTRAEVAIDPAEIVRSSRGARGTERSKNLTEDDVRAIRASEVGPTALSKFYKVTPATICDIRFRRSWTHIN